MFKISGKFRKEFRRTFGLWCCEERRFSRRRRHTSTIHTGGSAYICRYTTGGSTSYTARTEIMPLSALTSTVTIADVDWRRGRTQPTMPSMWDPEEKLEKKKRTSAVYLNYFTIHWNLTFLSKEFRCCFVSENRSWLWTILKCQFFFPVAQQPNAGQGCLILDVSWSHTMSHNSQ